MRRNFRTVVCRRRSQRLRVTAANGINQAGRVRHSLRYEGVQGLQFPNLGGLPVTAMPRFDPLNTIPAWQPVGSLRRHVRNPDQDIASMPVVEFQACAESQACRWASVYTQAPTPRQRIKFDWSAGVAQREGADRRRYWRK